MRKTPPQIQFDIFMAKYMRSLFALISILIINSLSSVTFAESASDRPKVALVLSGGGARGIAHIGVLKVLEENNVPVDIVVGTSMGAIVGGLYASGLPVEKLEQVVNSIDWQDAFRDKPPRSELAYRRKRDDDGVLVKFGVGLKGGEFILPKGLIQGQKLQLILQSLTLPVIHQTDFNYLPIRYRAIATNIKNGERVILENGNLARAMQASMSVPGIFAPVEIDGKLLTDGGVVNNLPVDVARNMGADIIIAVDIAAPLLNRDELDSVIAITDQVTRVMIQANAQQQKKLLSKNDILIIPDLNDVSATDFFQMEHAISQGELAARAKSSEIKKLAISETAYRAYQAKKKTGRQKNPTINKIRVINDTPLADEMISERIEAKVGEPLDLALLQQNISDIYGLATFDEVSFDVLSLEDSRELLINVRERDIGKHKLRFGLNIENDFKGDSTYAITARTTSLMLNRLGAEWQNNFQLGDTIKFSTDFLQPLDYLHKYFVNANLEYSDATREPVVNGVRTQNRIEQWKASAFVGRQFSNWGAIVAGVSRGGGEGRVRIGDTTNSPVKFNTGAYIVQAGYDTLDSIGFPHSGATALVELEFSRPSLGADNDYDSLSLLWAGAMTSKRNTLLLTMQGGTVFGSENAPVDQFALGGFLRLSGYGRDELAGRYYALQRNIFYHNLSDATLLSYPVYIGGSLEFGNVWSDISQVSADTLQVAGSLFLGVDSILGSVYLGVGQAEGGKSSLYLFLGQTF